MTSISEIIGLFNIVVGFMFVGAFTSFAGGIISYFVDFGNAERIGGIKLMEWGVAILFVLVVLLGAAQFFQSHTGATNVIAVIIVLILVAWVVLDLITTPSPPPKKEGGGA